MLVSYLIGLFDNLMEGGEDVESTTMVVEAVKGEWEGDEMSDGQAETDGDRQTDRQGVSAGTGTWGSGSTRWETHRYSHLSSGRSLRTVIVCL